ncbi:hypothetical protein [Variovorax sp. YR216]|uniref:hypothetical protein n=1 Tax=Variovorax sp. YR216 TaxID=1882828 RepID=UPI000894C4AB|nr:hypothetical protein [Variovorax sp. YR216]SEB25737.1 hypothetical protein SAMN05444680_12717 [Variovorax sp. YR216]
MTSAQTDRATFAGVLAQLVRNRCASGADRTSRTGLQATIPVSERPAVRRGIEGLIDAGVLAVHGEDIGFTADGWQFLAYAQKTQGQKAVVERHHADPAALERVLGKIEQDERFEPYRDLDEVRTLPARLENYRSLRHDKRMPMGWLVVTTVLVIVAAVVTLFIRR